MNERKHPDCICEECTLYDCKYVPSSIPLIQQYPAYWLGQGPGETETFTSVPFTGPAGKTHYSILRTVGLNKEMMPHGNVVNCWTPKDRKPSLRETLCCLPRLKRELNGEYYDHKKEEYVKFQKPKLLIALGEPAMNATTTLSKGITQHRGRVVNLKDDFELKLKVLVCLHPSFVMRQRQWIPIQAETYRLVHKYFSDGIEDEIEPTLILDPTAEELAAYLNTTAPVAWDTEATGLNTRKDTILGFSMSKSDSEAVAVALDGPDDPRWPVIIEVLKDKKRKKIWQNGSYDTSIIRYSEHNPQSIEDQGFIFDTRLAEQLINSDLPSDLDYLRGKYTQIKPYKPPKAERGRLHQWGREKMLIYAARDAVTTYSVYRKQLDELSEKEKGLMRTHLIPLVYAIGRMESRGVLVDIERLASMYAQAQPEIERIEHDFAKLGINPRSPKQVCAHFKLRSSAEATLKAQIKRNHPEKELMEKLLEYRGMYALASKYLKGVYNRLEDGRIHTHFKIEGTGTGRLSSSDPNLQNVPDVMRIIYIPDPNHCFIKADHSQIELWVGAYLAYRISDKDQMLRDLQDGLDIHYISCQLCFPHVKLKHGNRKEDFEHWQELVAKTVTFGTFYGRTPYSISREFGVTVAEAENWQLKLINKYPELSHYRQWCQRESDRKGFLETPFGRRRWIERTTQGYNFPVQSTASDITTGSIVESDRRGLIPVLSVHDDIVFQVPLEKFDEQLKEIKSTMEREVPELDNMKFKIDYEKGENWYELEKL